jgi:hypothetical protein
MPSVSATGDPTLFSVEDLDRILASLNPSSLPFDFTTPETDYSAFLIDYDGTRNAYYHDFGSISNTSEERIEPILSEPPFTTTQSNNVDVNNPMTRITSQATNGSSVVSPITHVSPTTLMSRTPSYNVSTKNESPMSPVSALSSPGVPSAPEPPTKPPMLQPITHSNPATRRVGGDWRRTFHERIRSG